MKKIFLTLIILLLPIGAAKAFDSDITIQIDGMTCEACVQTIEKSFRKLDSIADMDVNLETQTLLIDVIDNQDVSDEKIKELIEWGGYDLISIKRD